MGLVSLRNLLTYLTYLEWYLSREHIYSFTIAFLYCYCHRINITNKQYLLILILRALICSWIWWFQTSQNRSIHSNFSLSFPYCRSIHHHSTHQNACLHKTIQKFDHINSIHKFQMGGLFCIFWLKMLNVHFIRSILYMYNVYIHV